MEVGVPARVQGTVAVMVAVAAVAPAVRRPGVSGLLLNAAG